MNVTHQCKDDVNVYFVLCSCIVVSVEFYMLINHLKKENNIFMIFLDSELISMARLHMLLVFRGRVLML